MFITREADYAIRTVRALTSGERRTVKALCDEEYIPQLFAYKILKKLEQSEIVKSFRGPNGGYQLVKDPAAFTLLDIIKSVEEEVYVNECMRRGFHCENHSTDSPCMVHQELNRIQTVLFQSLSEKSMAEILSGQQGI